MTGKKLLKATGFRSHVLFHHGQLSGEYGQTTDYPFFDQMSASAEFRSVTIASHSAEADNGLGIKIGLLLILRADNSHLAVEHGRKGGSDVSRAMHLGHMLRPA